MSSLTTTSPRHPRMNRGRTANPSCLARTIAHQVPAKHQTMEQAAGTMWPRQLLANLRQGQAQVRPKPLKNKKRKYCACKCCCICKPGTLHTCDECLRQMGLESIPQCMPIQPQLTPKSGNVYLCHICIEQMGERLWAPSQAPSLETIAIIWQLRKSGANNKTSVATHIAQATGAPIEGGKTRGKSTKKHKKHETAQMHATLDPSNKEDK